MSGINAFAAEAANIAAMLYARTNIAVAFASDAEPLKAVPAAWPTGLARLGVTVAACEPCEIVEACDDWRAAEGSPTKVPPFCPAGRDAPKQ